VEARLRPSGYDGQPSRSEGWLANQSSEGAKVGTGEGIRTLDPDLGKGTGGVA
jgi:hypothetical protein